MASFHEVRKGTWVVRWRERRSDGTWRSCSKTMPEGSGRKVAEQWNREREVQLLMGQSSNWWTKGTERFGDYAWGWLDRKQPNLAPKTEQDYSTLLARYLAPTFGSVALRAIDVPMVEDFRDSALARGVGRRQLAQALGLLSQILKDAQRRGELQSNPAAIVERPRQDPRKPVRPLPVEQVERIRTWLLKHRTQRDAVLVSVLAYAGLRPGEALALRWGHFQGTQLHVEGAVSLGEIGPTKTRTTRPVDLLTPVRQDLAEFKLASKRPDDDVLIFRGEKKQLWTPGMWNNWRNREWYAALDALKLPRVHPYSLRHTYVSLRIAEGWNATEIADQAGHDVEQTLRTYGHVFKGYEPGKRVLAEERIRKAREGRKVAEA